LPGTFKNPHY